MKNHSLERKIEKAFQNAVPDQKDTILSDCKNRKGKLIVMTDTKKKRNWMPRIAGIAAAFLLVAGGGLGLLRYNNTQKVDAKVLLDVNPSIEIMLNKQERVLEVKAHNEEAKEVIADMDFSGSSLDITINALIGAMFRNGYLNDVQNSILISVENSNNVHGKALQEKLTNDINAIFAQNAVNGAILSQTVTDDKQLQQLAERYGITTGKAQLIRQITNKNPLYTFESLVALSINELNLLSASGNLELENIHTSGTASEKAYIGEEKAKTISLQHAGCEAGDITSYHCHLDLEDDVIVYEIEFDCNGYDYDYDINALTGAVVRHDKDYDDDQSTAKPDQYIGADKAKQTALSHAGIQSADAKGIECELDDENGVMVYEIEFHAGGNEYEYKINAATGAVIKNNVPAAPNEAPAVPQKTPAQNKNSEAFIGKSKAKTIALSNANVSNSSIKDYDCDLERKNGIAHYEIDFESGKYEYEYKINAVTGEIIHSHKEIDD